MKKCLVLFAALIAFSFPKMANAYTEIGHAVSYDHYNLYCIGLAICFTDNDPSNGTFRPGGIYIIRNLNGSGDVRAIIYSADDDSDGERVFPFQPLKDYSSNSKTSGDKSDKVQLFHGIEQSDVRVYAFNDNEE